MPLLFPCGKKALFVSNVGMIKVPKDICFENNIPAELTQPNQYFLAISF